MKIKKILFPTDFSELSNEALDLATSLARDYSASLLIVHVFDPPVAITGMTAHSSVAATSSAEQSSMLKQVVPSDPAIPYEHRLIGGAPSDGILNVAKEQNVDMIVMATHGHSGVTRLLMGSVAEAVVRHASCPVVTVKAGAETHAQSVEQQGAEQQNRETSTAQSSATQPSQQKQSTPKQSTNNQKSEQQQTTQQQSTDQPAGQPSPDQQVQRDAAAWAATEIHEAKQPHGVKHDEDLGTYRG